MISNRWFKTKLAAVAFCAAFSVSPAKADTTNLIALTTFESEVVSPETGEVVTPAQRPPWQPYTYPYSWGFGEAPPDSFRTMDTWYMDPPEGTNTVMMFTFDNSAYSPVPEGAGYGLGFGGPQNWIEKDLALLSTNRADYILSFDARVDGLLAGKSGNVEAQLIFVAPDDTLVPADDRTDPDTVFQLNMSFQPTSQWKRFTLNMAKAGFGSNTSQDMMAQFKDVITEIRFGFNLHMPHENYGFDSDNAVFIDNIRLERVERVQPPSLPVSEVVIAEWNFDDQGAWYSYPYQWSQNTAFNSFTSAHNTEGVGVDGGNAWTFQFDNTAFANARPGWAGGGSGTGGPFTAENIATANLASYKVYFDGRVEGLAADKSSTGGQMQFRLRGPDDIITPADNDQNDDTFFQANYDVTLKSNWQTFSFTFDQADVSDENLARFQTFYSQTRSLEPQFQVGGAASDFGADADNRVIIDNVRFVRLVQSVPPITIGLEASNVVLSWTPPASGSVKLQSATSLAGPFTDVQGATSPHTAPTTGSSMQFFRLQWVP